MEGGRAALLLYIGDGMSWVDWMGRESVVRSLLRIRSIRVVVCTVQ